MSFLRTLILLSVVGVAGTTFGQDYTLRFGDSVGAVGGEATIAVILDTIPEALEVSGWSLGVCHGPEVDIVEVVDGGTTSSLEPSFVNSQTSPGQGWAVGVVISLLGNVTLPPGNGYQVHLARYSLLEEGTAPLDFCNTIGSPPVETLVVDQFSGTFPPNQISGAIEIGLVPPIDVCLTDATGIPGDAVTFDVRADNPVPFDGFAFGIAAPADSFSFDQITPGQAIDDATGGAGPDYFFANLAPAGGEGATVACLLNLSAPFDEVPAGIDQQLCVIAGTIDENAAENSTIALTFTEALGTPAVLPRLVSAGTSITPILSNAEITVEEGITGTPFLRGDVSGDGDVALADAINLATYLFGMGDEPGCLVASDVNDDGGAGIDDVIVLLTYLFGGGAEPPAPFPTCGEDLTPDDQTCNVAPVCP